MSSSLLAVIQAAADEMGLTRPSTVIASTDLQTRQLLSLARREALQQLKEADWVQIQRPHNMLTVAGQQEYDLPADFDHFIVETAWDASQHEPIQGPLTPQEWQAIKSGIIGAGIAYFRYRVFRSATGTGTKFRVDPTPGDDGHDLVIEYVSSYYATSADGVTLKQTWTADTDLYLLSDNLLILGIIWRFLRAKGLDYQTQLLEYNQALDAQVSRNRPAPTLSLVQDTLGLRLLGPANVPDHFQIG